MFKKYLLELLEQQWKMKNVEKVMKMIALNFVIKISEKNQYPISDGGFVEAGFDELNPNFCIFGLTKIQTI